MRSRWLAVATTALVIGGCSDPDAFIELSLTELASALVNDDAASLRWEAAVDEVDFDLDIERFDALIRLSRSTSGSARVEVFAYRADNSLLLRGEATAEFERRIGERPIVPLALSRACTENLDCDDGADCSGIESCARGVCERAPDRPALEDGISCADRYEFCGTKTDRFGSDEGEVTVCLGDLECVQTTNERTECQITCAPEDVGLKGGCPGAEICLASNDLIFQDDGSGGSVACATPGTTEGCAPGFTCRESTSFRFDIDGFIYDPDYSCARPGGRCGVPSPVINDYAEAVDLSRELFCDQPSGEAHCPAILQPGSSASIECTSSGASDTYVGPDSQQVFCSGPGAITECPYDDGYDCLGNVRRTQRCLYLLKICVAFCESWDGQFEYDCGPGYSCAAPDLEPGALTAGVVYALDVERRLIQCESDEDCDPGFACGEFNNTDTVCMRNRRICSSL